MGPELLKKSLLILSAIFTAGAFISPFLTGYGSITGLDGSPGTIDSWNIYSGYDAVTCTFYFLGDFLCHQETSRSFILNGSQMPFCVRDAGLMIGFTIASAALCLGKRSVYPNRLTLSYIAVSFTIIIADWTIQAVFSLNVPLTRLITGAAAGFAIMLVLSMFIDGSIYRYVGRNDRHL